MEWLPDNGTECICDDRTEWLPEDGMKWLHEEAVEWLPDKWDGIAD